MGSEEGGRRPLPWYHSRPDAADLIVLWVTVLLAVAALLADWAGLIDG